MASLWVNTPTVVRLMKGACNQRPAQPKYSMTWDLSVVTRYVTSMGESHSLSLKLLSFKLVMLLASTRPSRSHGLSKLGLKYMKSLPDGVEFKPSSLTMQSRLFKPILLHLYSQPSSWIRTSAQKGTLSEYISRTETYRGSGSERKIELFLSCIKPHKLVFLCR